jgi:Xaa-Pro dipeptidase
MIISKVCDEIPTLIKNKVTENELVAEISYLIGKFGATGTAFSSIVAFGKNSANPHYSHSNVKPKIKDFMLFDMGAEYKKYCSDITRTFVYKRLGREHKDMYSTVLRAQELAFDEIRDSVDAKSVQKKVEKYINSTRYKGKFIHGLGHSIGLATHDGYSFSQSEKFVLKEGMVFTVEPGIYIPGFGGVRIEDDVLVKKNGIEVLTTACKELRVI